MSRFMIDIETMSVSLHNALVLSVAVLPFEVDRRDAPYIGTGHTWYPSLREQLAAGRQVDAETLAWWGRQVIAARHDWTFGEEVGLEAWRADLENFLGEAPEVWANGDAFDLGNLDGLLRHGRADRPWRYNAARDARTVYNSNPKLREAPGEALEKLTPHEPLSDCVMQVWRLWEHWAFKEGVLVE